MRIFKHCELTFVFKQIANLIHGYNRYNDAGEEMTGVPVSKLPRSCVYTNPIDGACYAFNSPEYTIYFIDDNIFDNDKFIEWAADRKVPLDKKRGVDNNQFTIELGRKKYGENVSIKSHALRNPRDLIEVTYTNNILVFDAVDIIKCEHGATMNSISYSDFKLDLLNPDFEVSNYREGFEYLLKGSPYRTLCCLGVLVRAVDFKDIGVIDVIIDGTPRKDVCSRCNALLYEDIYALYHDKKTDDYRCRLVCKYCLHGSKKEYLKIYKYEAVLTTKFPRTAAECLVLKYPKLSPELLAAINNRFYSIEYSGDDVITVQVNSLLKHLDTYRDKKILLIS